MNLRASILVILYQRSSKLLLLFLLVPGGWVGRGYADSLGTAFTYQGRLTDGVTAASGAYSLRFSIFDAASSGTRIGPTLTVTNVAISNGYFSVELDFGSGVFSGAARWLALEVATNGGLFTLLAPRQSITPGPFALYAASSGGLSGPIGSSQIATNQVVKSLNALKDSITLVAGTNASITTDSNANEVTVSAAVFPNNIAEYSIPGLYSITNTSSTRMVVELWGAGGGGGGAGGFGSCNGSFYPAGPGGSGGAGGYCRAVLTLQLGAVYKIRCGSGGAGGAAGFTNPNSSGTPGQPGQPGQDMTVEDANGGVLLRSTGGQAGGGGPGGVCNVFSQNPGTNGPPGFGDLNAPIRRVGFTTGSITPVGVTGGASGAAGGNGYAIIMW